MIEEPLPLVVEAVYETRMQRYDDIGTDPRRNDKILLDDIPANIIALCETLEERWLDPYIVWGSLSYHPGNHDSVETAYRTDCEHVWVEVAPRTEDDARYVAEVAGEARLDDRRGLPRVSSTRPDGYQTHGRCALRYDETVTPRMVSLEGFQTAQAAERLEEPAWDDV